MKNKKNHLFLPPTITPIVGFILQKDVYTTNLLYANDQFSTKFLRKTLPFRKSFSNIKTSPNSCMSILNEKKPNLEINDEIIKFQKYLFKPKKLRNKRLKFPLPKMKTIPLRNAILHEEICKENLRIKFLKDDSNISSKYGKKLIYNLRNKNSEHLMKKNNDNTNNTFKTRNSLKLYFQSLLDDKKDGNNNTKDNYHLKTLVSNAKPKFHKDFKLDKLHKRNSIRNSPDKSISELRKDICQINDDLKMLYLKDAERKNIFYKKDFFSTQIYNKINMKTFSNN